MLSGQRAFQREVAVETMTAILRDDPPELATARLDFSPAPGRIVHHCLEKNPTERFAQVSLPSQWTTSLRITVRARTQYRARFAPRWRRDGKELFYLAQDGTMMTVAVRQSGSSSIDFGVPQPLFRTRLSEPSAHVEQFDVSADGQRFVITPQDSAAGQHMNLLLNWTARLK